MWEQVNDMAELAKPLPIDWTERLKNWREALLTMNLPDDRMDGVSRWLIITRAGVIPMTLTSGLIGGLSRALRSILQESQDSVLREAQIRVARR